MSVSTTTNRISYTGNGATLAYTVPYQYYDQTHLKVYVNAVLQTLTTNYTVSPTTNTPHGTVGGTVTFLVAPGLGLNVLIIRQVPNTQTSTLQDLSVFPATTVEQMSDLLTFANQQQDETAGRAITIPITSSLSSVQIPDPALTANQGLYLQTYSGGLQLASAPIGTTNPVTTKGDLITSQGGSTPSRLPVGTGPLVGDSSQASGIKWKAPGADGTVLKADSTQTDGLVWSNPAALDGIRGLSVVPRNVVQGTWVNSTTTFASVASALYNFFDGTAADGHILSDTSAFYAANFLISVAASPTTVVYEYWNGSAWTAFTPTVAATWTAVGYTQARWTSALTPGWVAGGSGTGVPAGSFNLRIRQTVGTTTVTGRASLANRVDITADEVIASNGIAKVATQSLGTISPDILVAGSAANGRDQAGAFTLSTYVYLWLIYNPTTTTWAGLWSASATAPTLPTGYTFKVRVGGYRVDANILLLPWYQAGNEVTYPSTITDLSAGAATTWTAFTISVPPIAISFKSLWRTTGGAAVSVGPEPGSALTVVFAGVAASTPQIGATWTPIKIAQTLYYNVSSNNGSNDGCGYRMPGNLS